MAIFAAERKLQEARRDTIDSVSRLRTAVNTRLRRPSTILCAAGLGALAVTVFALSGQRRTRRVPAERATAASIGAIVSAFLARQAWQELSRLLFRLWKDPNSARFPRRDELHARDHVTRPSSTRRVVH